MHSAAALPTLLLTGALAAQPVPQHHWPLDETNGTQAHDLAGGSHGSLQGGPVWAPTGGYHGGAVRCDGVDDRVLLGACDPTNGGQGITIALWFKPDFVTAMERTLIAKASGPAAQAHIWSISLVNATALRFRLRTGSTTAELTTPPASLFGGQWYHVVGSYDGAVMRLHLNGALMATSARSGLIGYHPSITAAIGAMPDASAPFSGWIDDVRIYPVGLSEPQVLGLLMTSVPTSTSGMHGIFPMSGSMWAEAHDLSGRLMWSGWFWHPGNGLPSLPPGLYVITLHGMPERRMVRVLPQ
jgi:hypothetical protein